MRFPDVERWWYPELSTMEQFVLAIALLYPVTAVFPLLSTPLTGKQVFVAVLTIALGFAVALFVLYTASLRRTRALPGHRP